MCSLTLAKIEQIIAQIGPNVPIGEARLKRVYDLLETEHLQVSLEPDALTTLENFVGMPILDHAKT
jgi:hypothetical protein